MTDPVLSPAQLRVLRILSNADAPLRALDVAQAVGVPYGTVYHAFRVLYDAGWAVGVTEKNPVRGRPSLVLYRLTATGRKKAAAVLDSGPAETKET